ncbi:MAG: hypothetical protein AB9883_07585 [Acidaminococcaceae bacterium]
MAGWVKLHRTLLGNRTWKKATAVQKVIMITFLLRAASSEFTWEKQGNKILLKPGQLFIRLKEFSEEQEITVRGLRTTIKYLEDDGFILADGRPTGTIITICNWQKYQYTSDTPFDTPNDIQNDTPKNEENKDGEPVTEHEEIKNDTPFDTPNDTPNDTQIKNIYINNKYNKNKTNKTAADLTADRQAAFRKYESNFGCISPSVLAELQDIMISRGSLWVSRAIEELLERKTELAKTGEYIKSPGKYLLSILRSWESSGKEKPWEKPEHKITEQCTTEVIDFYKSLGVEV